VAKICISCGKDHSQSNEKYCGSCGNKIVEKREDFIRAQCTQCGKPIMAHKNASMHLCDYHWSVYDAMEGY